MSRPLLFPLTMLLFIATAFAMLASAMLLPMSGVAVLSEPDGEEVVQRFYAAVNETIETGTFAALRRVIDPSFADENPLPGVAPGRAGLEAYLVTLHEIDPGLRLEAEVLVASQGQVAARVQVRQAVQVASQAASLIQRRVAWSPIEVFRIADGVIVSRWNHTAGLALARPITVQQVELPLPTPRVVSLMRVTLAPGSRWDAPRIAGPRLLYLEEGVLDVQSMPGPVWDAAPNPTPEHIRSNTARANAIPHAMLTAGKTWQALPGSSTSATSAGNTPAHLLVVSFAEPQILHGPAPAPAAGSLSSGVTAQVLAGDLATDLGMGPLRVTLEQVALAPDAALNLWSTEGPILLAVVNGQLETTTQGTGWIRRSRDGMSTPAHEDVQTTANGMMLQPGGMVALRNLEQRSAQALVVTIKHAGPDQAP